MKLSLLLFLPLFALATRGNASHLRLSGRVGPTSPTLQRRGASLDNAGDLKYTANITLNGKQFSVLVDTGSSELWVSPTVPNAVSRNYSTSATYGKGSAEGTVMSATLGLAGLTVEDQFFIYAPNGSAAPGCDGIIGLGLSSGSGVRLGGNSSAANPPLDRIFASNSSISPLLAILLQRSNDPDEPFPGDLSVGEVLPNYQDVLNQPRLPLTVVPASSGAIQHWQTLLDLDGFIAPNGTRIEIKTHLTGTQTQNAIALLDTGFSLSQVPSYVAEALYGGIPGAVMQDSALGRLWFFDCDQEINASFVFGGVQLPIHPLDLNFDGFNLQEDGRKACVGGFQPFDQANDTMYDLFLGMTFLRNAYMAINLGNTVNNTDYTNNTAYIQLLSITNATQASQDFANLRKKGNNAALSISNPSKPWLIGLIVGFGLLHILA